MFSTQANKFENFVDLGMDPRLAGSMRDLFGNCQAELRHDGRVIFNGEVVSTKLQAGTWAVAVHNWQHSGTVPSQGGTIAWVNARLVTDSSGTSWLGDETINVYLPVPKGQDPNVVKGDVFPVKYMNNGVYVAEGMGEESVGTMRQGINTTVPTGWAIMDGTSNASGNGGSGIDMSDSFLRPYSTSNQIQTTGGAATDTITAATIASKVADHSADNTGNTAEATHSAGVTGSTTEADHAASTTGSGADASHGTHTHTVGSTTIQEGTGATVGVLDTSPTDASPELTHAGHTHSTPALSHAGHTHTTPALTHAGHTHTTPALTHAGTGADITVDTVPPFTYVACLERLNNSRNSVETS